MSDSRGFFACLFLEASESLQIIHSHVRLQKTAHNLALFLFNILPQVFKIR